MARQSQRGLSWAVLLALLLVLQIGALPLLALLHGQTMHGAKASASTTTETHAAAAPEAAEAAEACALCLALASLPAALPSTHTQHALARPCCNSLLLPAASAHAAPACRPPPGRAPPSQFA